MTFKRLLQTLSITAVVTSLAACSGGTESTNTTQNQTQTQTTVTNTNGTPSTAEVGADVITLDTGVELSEVSESTADSGDGVLKVAFDTLDTTDIENKLVFIPATDGQLDDVLIKVTSATVLNEYDANGKQLAEIEYSSPAIDEVFEAVDYELPDNVLETAEITHYFYPESFEQAAPSQLAGRLANRDGAKLTWFPNIDWNLLDYKEKESLGSDKTGASLDFGNITILSYGVDGEDPLGKVSMSGSWDLVVNKLKNSFDKVELGQLNESVLLDTTTRTNFEFDFEGDFEFSASVLDELGAKQYRCGVSKVSTGERFGYDFSLTGAYWNKNVCLGGVRFALTPLPVYAGPLDGNGERSLIQLPVSLDIFVTMNADLVVSASSSLTVSRKNRTVRRVDLQDGNLSVSSTEYDPDATTLLALDPNTDTSKIDVELTGSVSGSLSKKTGLAAGLKVAGIYPVVMEAWGEMAIRGQVEANAFDIVPGGDAFLCFSVSVEPEAKFRFAVGLAAAATAINADGSTQRRWGSGVSYEYENTLWELPTPLAYDSCDPDEYDLSLTVDTSQSGRAVLSDLVLSNTDTAQSLTLSSVYLVVYDASGNVVKQQSGLSEDLLLDGLDAGSYRIAVGVEASDGTRFKKMINFEVAQELDAPTNLSLATGNGKIALSWNATPNATGYSVCHSDAPIVSFDDCAMRLGSIWEPILTNQLEVNQLPNGNLLVEGQTYYFGLVAQDADGNTSDMSAAASVLYQVAATPVATGKLNDTGITQCADDSTNGLSCPVSGYPNQDAQTGRDLTNNDDSDGHAGFSFTKLDTNGNPLLANATSWSCVQDNVTGLIWEVKRGGNGVYGDEGLHDADDRYNWYSTDSSNNGGYVGYENDDGAICHGYSSNNSASYCNTQAFVERVNQAGLCGANDWRLPTRESLRSIASYDRVHPAIDTDYFQFTKNNEYWSSSPKYASLFARYVQFKSGVSGDGPKSYALYVRLVRGGQ